MENVKSEGMQSKVVREYSLKVENCSVGDGNDVVMYSVYAPDGGYVGIIEDVSKYFSKGILPELSSPDNKVCSIGKSLNDGKWYGWSHRAMHGFQIGDVAKEGDLVTQSGYVEEYAKLHPELDRTVPVGFTAKTEEDAKKMAIAFADSVS